MKAAIEQKVFRSKWRLHTIVLIVNFSLLLLPLGGLLFFRIYENELLRQTELELIVQGTFTSSLYRSELHRMLAESYRYGKVLENYNPHLLDNFYTPVYPRVDLADREILEPRPDSEPVSLIADRIAIDAASRVFPILTEIQKTTLAGIRLLDANGIVIAGKEDVGKSFAHVEEVQSAIQGHYTSVIRRSKNQDFNPPLASISRSTGIRIFVAYPIIENGRLWGVVYLSRSPQSILKHLNSEKQKVIIAGLTVVGIALLITFFSIYMVTKPLHRLMSQAKRISSGDVTAIRPLYRPITREVEMLSESFLRMAQALHSRGEYIRDFANRVSHEFKTPLTAIRGGAELLLEHADTMQSEEKQKFLTNIMKDTQRLTRLVQRLLELARADNLKADGGTADALHLCQTLRERYRDTLEIAIESVMPVNLLISSDNLDTVFSNLLDNSRYHKASRVVISSELDKDFTVFTVVDDGEGVSPANRDRLFVPFFTTRRDSGGTGLGLGIVASLLKAHGGTIELAESHKGATFILRLPYEIVMPKSE